MKELIRRRSLENDANNMDVIKQNYTKTLNVINSVFTKTAHKQYPQLIVVTKRQSIEDISRLYELGARHFGENRVDALIKRQNEFPQNDIVWHFIGTLQTRKVKQIIDRIDYLHSLDRFSLMDEIEKRATTPLKCFIQINIFGEKSKNGFSTEDISTILDKVKTYSKIEVIGLMCMAPFNSDSKVIEKGFQQLVDLQKEIASYGINNCPCRYVSMGMSQDYVLAIKQGATHLRIGSALFEK